MVKTNADCAALSEDLRDIYADLTVFIITQFQLHRDDDAVYLSIIEFCNAQKITPTVFYGSLLNDLERVGREIYAWEPSSAYYDSLLLFDPVLVAECEEAMYPLSSAEAEALLEGSLGLAVMRGKLAEHLSGQIEDDPLELTPGTFVEKLELN